MGVRRRSFGSCYAIQRRYDYELRRLQAFHTRYSTMTNHSFFMVNAREAKNNEEALRVEVFSVKI